MTAPSMRRDLSPLTSASLEAGNVVLREVDPSGPRTVVRAVTLRPEERRALVAFLAEVERLEVLAEAEVLCGALRPEDDAYCAELVGHEDAGLDHLWVGGVHNLCMAEPVRLALSKPECERKEQR
jgi:hypothetical protein